jgi:hypothetical protein
MAAIRMLQRSSQCIAGGRIRALRGEPRGHLRALGPDRGQVVGAVAPRIRSTEIERARRKPTESLDAYDLYLRAVPHHLSSRRERLVEAQVLLHRAIKHDPDFSLAKAFSALTCVSQANQGWTTPGERALGVRRAREALACGSAWNVDPLSGGIGVQN